ncbi:hypothetical protein BV898_18212 [Hypsibius exemplaris]|uniref:Uncharacterized protein n=1 Tax=Hypsibius exemplaris TaxID=2072580 RepID=A0A9X6NJC8_HYPEX|nr:hypothetical protein BV898_18212 [Hypsibius exemplaris]
MSSTTFPLLSLFSGITCLMMIAAIGLPLLPRSINAEAVVDGLLQETSLIGHDPRLFTSSGFAPSSSLVTPFIRRQQYTQRIARGRPPFYSARILGRLSSADRGRSSFLPSPSDSTSAAIPQGLYWMRQPGGLGGGGSGGGTDGSARAPIVPRGPAGMRMLAEWNAEKEAAAAANRPLPPLWSLLQAPRRNRARRSVLTH